MLPNKTSIFHHLKSKWVKRHGGLQEKLWSKHGESLNWFAQKASKFAVSSLGSAMLLAVPGTPQILSSQPFLASAQVGKPFDKQTFLMADLAKILPSEMRELTPAEEEHAASILSRDFKLKLAAELDGKRLNRTYGFIGAEQHLARYPDDTMVSHFDTQEEATLYTSSGMAPGLGAWGYFASSAQEMTEKDKMREKYYIAVQTFLSKDFNTRFAQYRDFFKYRKMLVVNPDNGKAIVAVIGDAGPAAWTGKHLGGSPEVMKHLERFDGKSRGGVLYFFIDDPNDLIPLGPIDIQ